MKINFVARVAFFALLVCLQACTAPTTTSERYRVLSIPVMESVIAGMTQTEAWRILGEPWSSVVYRLRPDETYYNWKWRNDQNEGMMFAVVLDSNSRVVRTETWRDLHDAKNISAPSWN